MTRWAVAILITATIYMIVWILRAPIERFLGRSLFERRRQRHERLLADRLAAGHDRYFEELRALQAYPPQRRKNREIAFATMLPDKAVEIAFGVTSFLMTVLTVHMFLVR